MSAGETGATGVALAVARVEAAHRRLEADHEACWSNNDRDQAALEKRISDLESRCWKKPTWWPR